MFHRVMLLGALAILGLSLVLEVRGDAEVVVPILDKPLPPSCMFRRWLQIDCPGCGLTRSFIELAHGRFARAWRFNPAGVALFLLVLAQIPYRTVQLARIRCGREELRPRRLSNWFAAGLIVFLLGQWVCRLATAWL